ncbi:hypothetical protein FCM35_KLT14037 [Carex littledalei]|uniref:Ubiquitin-like protease family profile domain-containing protein n=1 Tax=Carex littledalei TaxID=544730 RepID=A0A833V0I1_9POAL|nr:hypothetical protein FCM35_KLT14037 [Carex littledalei]
MEEHGVLVDDSEDRSEDEVEEKTEFPKMLMRKMMRVQFIRDLMLPEHDVSSELLELVLQVMQLETHVRHPWFFISPYIVSIMHLYDHETALKNLPQLFSNQFKKIKWLFIPVCAKEHWVLAAFDLKCKKVLYYTSAGESDKFWKTVLFDFQQCPKQYNSRDCSIFVLRFVYNLITESKMDFVRNGDVF